MSLKHNILANYASQFYVTLIGIVMVPIHVRYMGAEAYGLVGFYAMLQAWFQVLDMGLTPTMTRETARFRGGACDAMSLRLLLRSMEGIFIGVAALGSVVIIALSAVIADGWLNAQHLRSDELQQAIALMALVVALRWISGMYRGAISGFERLVWLGGFNVGVATARFVLVIPFFLVVGTGPVDFFLYQLGVSILEIVVLVLKTYRLLPKLDRGQRVAWRWEPLRGVLGFSLSIAFTSLVWIMVTQTDKLLLSKLLSLKEYAYFTLAVMLANGVIMVSAPINGAVLPRLNELASRTDDEEFYNFYRWGTQLVALIALPAAAVLAAFAEKIMWIWTGNQEIAQHAAPVLMLYAMGNGLFAISSFSAHLQVAKGDLRLHVIGNVLFLVLQIPTLVWSTANYGVVGAGYSWFFMNVIYLLFWVPKVHRRFQYGLHHAWFKIDVAGILLFSIAGSVAVRLLLTWSEDRILAGAQLMMVCTAIFFTATAGSPVARHKLRNALHL